MTAGYRDFRPRDEDPEISPYDPERGRIIQRL